MHTRSLRRPFHRVAALTALLSLSLAREAVADPSMDDQRVSLPGGTGSVGGLGDNLNFASNMGLMSYSVPLTVPGGREGLTPVLSFEYSSGAGNGLMGLGWGMPSSSIERTTHRGLPRYTTSDVFAADGGEHLVYVGSSGGVRTYRARYERGFVRYRWHAAGDGKAGYWTAENPDGTVDYYGADRTGQLVSSARVTGPAGEVFRYHLVERVDPFGNRMRFEYVNTDGEVLLDTIAYAFSASGTPRYRVSFVYETRADQVSDATAGFEVPSAQRLSEVRVYAGTEVVRRYDIAYEEYAQSGGLSRVAALQEYGRNDAKLPVKHTFGYTRALGASCSGPGCDQPFVVDMGSLAEGVDLATGRAALVDINADGLPDVVNTSADGSEHTFYLSELGANGQPVFSGAAVSSTAQTSGFVLGTPGVQLLDVNGDGRVDMINARTADVLCNDGTGDWGGSDCLGDASLPLEDIDSEDGSSNPTGVRFLDYDNDRRIDLLRTANVNETDVYANTGERFENATVDPIGAVFDQDDLRLADLNGDGLQDPVQILSSGELRARINLGFGRWSEWRTLALEGLDAASLLAADIEDLNGDGLDDVVVIAGNSLKYALNRGGEAFDAPVTIASADIEGDLPERTATTTILFSDMNGNGTSDPMWVSSSGRVQFLELFPQRSNLLSRTDNGRGLIQEVRYTSSVKMRFEDQQAGRLWRYPMPNAVNVVAGVDSWVRTTGREGGEGLHERISFHYRDGFYDAVERTFRGFGEREERVEADTALDSQEPGLTREVYDVGATDPYRHGLRVRAENFAGAGDDLEPLAFADFEYEDCAVEGVPSGTVPAVRHLCLTGRMTAYQERAPESEWIWTRDELEYDGYGRIVTTRELGVVQRGAADAPACGALCEGDERVTRFEWVAPGEASGKWLLESMSRQTMGEGQAISETRFYYDGEAFKGLPLGQQSHGLLTREEERVASGDGDEAFEPVTRARYSEDGNLVEMIMPRGSPENTTAFRKRMTYDADGLRLVRTERLVDDGEPYILREDLLYDEPTGQVGEVTDLMLVRDGQVVSARNSTRLRFDDFGRPVATIRPGDTPEAPTFTQTYELGPVATRSITQGRSRANGTLDIETIDCIDGRGRVFQTRTRISQDLYSVSGFEVYNRLGSPIKRYHGYQSTSAACDLAPPADVAATTFRYDATGRQIASATVAGGQSLGGTRVVFEPLASVTWDDEDDQADGPFANTPTREEFDGLGRTIRSTRTLPGGDEVSLSLAYDDLDRLIAVDDPAGDRQEQVFDLRGRATELHTLNAGTITQAWNENSDIVAMTDARGVTIRYEFDSVDRMTAMGKDGDASTRIAFVFDEVDGCDDCTHTAGRLAAMRFPLATDGSTGLDQLGYDARGNVIHRSRSLEGHAFILRYAYDNLGRVVRTTYPDGQELTRTYDSLGRATSIGGVLDQLDYESRGLVSAMRYANGVVTSMEYDAERRLVATRTKRGDAVLHGQAFTYDRADNLTREDDLATSAGRPPVSVGYTYDALYRLTEARYESTGGGTTLAMAFDDRDNITSLSSIGAFTYGSDRPNAVTAAGDLTFDYDATGRMVRRGDRAFVRDHFGRITEVTSPGHRATFAYGPLLERVMKIEDGETTYYVDPEFEVRDGIASVMPRIGRTRVARLTSDALATTVLSDLAVKGETPDGRIDAADAWVAHARAEGLVEVDATLPESAPVDRLLAASARRLLFEATGDVTFLHHDIRGSVTAATDADGVLVGARSFLPTGKAYGVFGYVDPYGFTGQELDASTGLIHFPARSLDPEIGRWTSPDPLFAQLDGTLATAHGESMSGYAYIANSFVNGFDPTGLKWSFKSLKKKIVRYFTTIDTGYSIKQVSVVEKLFGKKAYEVWTKVTASFRLKWQNTLYQKKFGLTLLNVAFTMASHGVQMVAMIMQVSGGLNALITGDESLSNTASDLRDVADNYLMPLVAPMAMGTRIASAMVGSQLLNWKFEQAEKLKAQVKDLENNIRQRNAALEATRRELSKPASLL
jgi:RHS repeat-associated protein